MFKQLSLQDSAGAPSREDAKSGQGSRSDSHVCIVRQVCLGTKTASLCGMNLQLIVTACFYKMKNSHCCNPLTAVKAGFVKHTPTLWALTPAASRGAGTVANLSMPL